MQAQPIPVQMPIQPVQVVNPVTQNPVSATQQELDDKAHKLKVNARSFVPKKKTPIENGTDAQKLDETPAKDEKIVDVSQQKAKYVAKGPEKQQQVSPIKSFEQNVDKQKEPIAFKLSQETPEIVKVDMTLFPNVPEANDKAVIKNVTDSTKTQLFDLSAIREILKLKISQELPYSILSTIIKRDTQEKEDRRKKGGKTNKNYGQQKNNRKGADDFIKGVEAPPKDLSTDQLVVWRKERSAEREQLKESSKKWKENIQKLNKVDPVVNEIKMILNKITPNNIDNLQKKLGEILVKPDENQTEEERKETPFPQMEKVVNQIFKKAWTEEKYCEIYSRLCQYLSHKELKFHNIDVSKKNYKNSKFRKNILSICQSVFSQLFTE